LDNNHPDYSIPDAWFVVMIVIIAAVITMIYKCGFSFLGKQAQFMTGVSIISLHTHLQMKKLDGDHR